MSVSSFRRGQASWKFGSGFETSNASGRAPARVGNKTQGRRPLPEVLLMYLDWKKLVIAGSEDVRLSMFVPVDY